MFYQMHEGYIKLDDSWKDQSMNVLVSENSQIKGLNFVVSRDRMPLGMKFEDYIYQQKKNFENELYKFKLVEESKGVIDDQPAQFMEITWESQGRLLQQLMGVLHVTVRILSLTITIPGGGCNGEEKEAFFKIIKNFKFGIRPNSGEEYDK